MTLRTLRSTRLGAENEGPCVFGPTAGNENFSLDVAQDCGGLAYSTHSRFWPPVELPKGHLSHVEIHVAFARCFVSLPASIPVLQ